MGLGALLAGMCARRRSHFLLSRQKKVTKEKATPLAVSLRFAAGSLRCSVAGRRCGTRFAGRGTPLVAGGNPGSGGHRDGLLRGLSRDTHAT